MKETECNRTKISGLFKNMEAKGIDFIMDYPRSLSAVFIMYSVSEVVNSGSDSFLQNIWYFFASIGIYKVLWTFLSFFETSTKE